MAVTGFSPSETATFVFSLKEPLFDLLGKEIGSDAARLRTEVWTATRLLDKLGLYTTECYQAGRQAIINRQQEELLELSTPVIKLYEGILAIPLIGTLDSARTQVVMESFLTQIVAARAQMAIIDITGVPTVDTLKRADVAQASMAPGTPTPGSDEEIAKEAETEKLDP